MEHEHVSQGREQTPEESSTTETTGDPESWVAWQRIGRHALRLERPAELRRLREITDELATLVIYEHWRANGRNASRTSADLGISRRRVAEAVQQRLGALASEGGQ